MLYFVAAGKVILERKCSSKKNRRCSAAYLASERILKGLIAFGTDESLGGATDPSLNISGALCSDKSLVPNAFMAL